MKQAWSPGVRCRGPSLRPQKVMLAERLRAQDLTEADELERDTTLRKRGGQLDQGGGEGHRAWGRYCVTL